MNDNPLQVLTSVPAATPRVDVLDELLGSALGAKPALRLLEDEPGARETEAALGRMLEGLRTYRIGRPSLIYSLAHSPEAVSRLLAETLGEGEVSIAVTGRHLYRITETALAGLWRVEVCEPNGEVRSELLEIADVPSVVRAANAEATNDTLSIGTPPEGAMNVLGVLAELRHRQRGYRLGERNHVMSLSLLPFNELDARYLETQLGHGPVLAESKGYGRCRVELSAARHVWSVQHFNSQGVVVLDALEVGDVPAAVVAAREDFEDSAARLGELLEQ